MTSQESQARRGNHTSFGDLRASRTQPCGEPTGNPTSRFPSILSQNDSNGACWLFFAKNITQGESEVPNGRAVEGVLARYTSYPIRAKKLRLVRHFPIYCSPQSSFPYTLPLPAKAAFGVR